MKFSKIILLLTTLTFISACSSTHKVIAPKDAYALQELQTREVESNFKTSYASVLSVLQDAGYIVESADGNAGLITAKSPTTSGTKYSLMWGFGKERKSTRVTAFIEPIGTQYSKIRLNFLEVEVDSNIYGMNSQKDTPIEDPAVYNSIFDKIEEAIFLRQATQ